MPTFPGNFGALALHPGLIESDAYIFLDTGSTTGVLDAFLRLHDGSTVPMYSLRDINTIYNGSGAPGTGIGWSGDFYIDTGSPYYTLYGPKPSDSGAWSAGVSLVGTTGLQGPSGATGATGPTGATGAQGAAGTGIATGGVSGQILYKTSSTDYATGWVRPLDILKKSKIYNLDNYENIKTTALRKTVGFSSTALSSSLGSGLTYSGIRNSLFIVDNATPAIYEFSATGWYIRKITLSGFDDIEAIDWMYDDYFVIAEEGNPTIVNELSVVHLWGTEDMTVTKNSTNWVKTIDTNTTSNSNKGIEGVAYNPYEDRFYFVTEKPYSGTWNLWVIDNDTGATAESVFDLNTPLSGVATDISDLHFSRLTGTLFLLSDESDYIIEMNLDGEIMQLAVSPFTERSEGLAFSEDGQFMYVTKEGGTNAKISIAQYHGPTSNHVGSTFGAIEYNYRDKTHIVTSRFFNEIPSSTNFSGNTITSGGSFYMGPFESAANNVAFTSGDLRVGQKMLMKAHGLITSYGGFSLQVQPYFYGGVSGYNFLSSGRLEVQSGLTNVPWQYECNFSVYDTGANSILYAATSFLDIYAPLKQSVGGYNIDALSTASVSYYPAVLFTSLSGSGTLRVFSVDLYQV